jgi:energy-coupling factor transport system ATP-binding protein
MITFERVSYCYPEADLPTLREVDLHLPEGCFVLVVGVSGAGKSTLLRCINGLVPHFSGGELTGYIEVDGQQPVLVGPQQMSRHVGFVFQDPEAQFVVDQVEDEIAFALEHAAMPRQEMRIRIEEVLDLLDLAPLRGRRLDTLSGGERQRVAIAAGLALRPKVLVLDEPTSQLDPKSAEDVLHTLFRLNSDLGLTVILAEHRLERVMAFADTLILLPDDGNGVCVGTPAEMAQQMGLTPPLVSLGKALGWEPLPLTIKQGRQFARAMEQTIPAPPPPPAAQTISPSKSRQPSRSRQSQEKPVIQVHKLDVTYGGRAALRGVSLEVQPGEMVALMGRNGSGKTTLLRTIVGLVKQRRGEIAVMGRSIAGRDTADICREVGYVPQDPGALLFAETVLEELTITLNNHGQQATTPFAPHDLLERLHLSDKAHRYPRDLSAGERQRVALAAVAVVRPRVLLLDEPTRGLDYAAKQGLIDLLNDWRSEGGAVVLVTHDVELVAALADRVVLLSQGEVIASGTPADVLGASPLFAPQVARLFPGRGWMTVGDALAGIRG